MKRIKRHKIKTEKAESSSSKAREQEEHDLAYYIHDRVELMHQVFSILKYKELKTMAPECVRNLAIGDLQELCTEELLGISSKRLLAILDGAEPPSDTESSSPSPPPDFETISLDSISSDEELLASSSNKKKKHKHHRRNSKSKSKKKEKSKEPEPQADENAELSRASRAGLTVLELLELQARARAIRAQLQQEQNNKRPSETTAVGSNHHSSDNDEVEIKEEPPDVVEISSEDEKPDVNKLKKGIAEKTASPKAPEAEAVKNTETDKNSATVTKRINDLIITVPQAKPTRKIKLNRNKVTVSVPNDSDPALSETRSVTIAANTVAEHSVNNYKSTQDTTTENKAKKKAKRKKRKTLEKEGSDHDEITLQLSDSEKMDLFEDLDESRKNYDRVSSSSEDTESSSSDSENGNSSKDSSAELPASLVHSESSSTKYLEENNDTDKNNSEIVKENNPNESTKSSTGKLQHEEENIENTSRINKLCTENQKKYLDDQIYVQPEINNSKENCSTKGPTNGSSLVYENVDSSSGQNASEKFLIITDTTETCTDTVEEKSLDKEVNTHDKSSIIEITSIEDIPILSDSIVRNVENNLQGNTDKDEELVKDHEKDEDLNKDSEIAEELTKGFEKDEEVAKDPEKDLSDGQLSDRQSSEVEAIDVQPDVVCISDEESTSKNKNDKKKKKKDKKCKKEKKSKKSKSDFHKDSDQNFYRDANEVTNERNGAKSPFKEISTFHEKTIDLDSDDVYEILELSDDSSCYEVEGTVLSKEPTAEEIEALSAKIDEIERVEVVTDEQIRAHEQMIAEKDACEQSDKNVDHISWKDRYLGSNKVKKVLTTANIFNALRKKNKELKKKIETSKKKDVNVILNEENAPKDINIQIEEGSIEQYNALQGSTKYVDPVKVSVEAPNNKEDEKVCAKEAEEANVTIEMKKDAKKLLKMYKRLLKHNDMNKQKDPEKKKKKKQRKKDKQDCVTNLVEANCTKNPTINK